MHDLPEGWIETTLGEVVDSANTGLDAIKRAPIVEENTGIKCLRIQDVSQGKDIYAWGNAKVLNKDFEKARLRAGDLIMARTCTPGIVYFVKSDLQSVFNNGLVRIRVTKEKSSPIFLYYTFKSRRFTGYIHGISQGTSVQLNMKVRDLLGYDFYLPPLPEQKAIADMLSSFDEKIELLREQNKTLETLAQTIFKEWFVHFNFPDPHGKPYRNNGGAMVASELGLIPQGWRVGKLGEVTNIKGGGTPSTKNKAFWNGDIHWTSPKDLSNAKSIFLLDTEKKLTSEGLKKISSGLMPKGTLLLSSRAPIGYLAISNVDIAINQGYIALLGNAYFSNDYMLFWLKTHMKAVTNAANGSTFLEISKSAFRNIDSVIPSESVLKAYNQAIEPILNKMLQNIKQVQTLSKTRDTLLPKLMSGSVLLNEGALCD